MTKILMVSSKGGHFNELLQLKEVIKKYKPIIVVEEHDSNIQVDYFLKTGTRVHLFKYIGVVIINFFKTIFILKKERPDIIISTGAHSCVWFFYLAKIFKIKTIYIESFAVFNGKSLTYKLIKPICTKCIVQHENNLIQYKKGIYFGGIY